jgi:hypothetical protein
MTAAKLFGINFAIPPKYAGSNSIDKVSPRDKICTVPTTFTMWKELVGKVLNGTTFARIALVFSFDIIALIPLSVFLPRYCFVYLFIFVPLHYIPNFYQQHPQYIQFIFHFIAYITWTLILSGGNSYVQTIRLDTDDPFVLCAGLVLYYLHFIHFIWTFTLVKKKDVKYITVKEFQPLPPRLVAKK